MGRDVIEEEQKQSSIKMLRNFDSLIFGSIFPHIDTLNDKSHKLSNLYGRPTRGTSFSFSLFLDQVKFYYYLDRRGYITLVRRKEDLEKPGIKVLLSLEGADVLRDYEDIYLLKELHVYNLGLTWNYDNKFASSCMSNKDYGLTDEGEELVKTANSLGIIIDLAHAGKRTLLDVASISKRPIIVSHGNARKLKDHRRNLDDEEIEAIVKTNGVIGVTAIVETLREPTINGLVENIKYIGESFGWEYVAIGTDFLGIQKVPEGFENVMKLRELSDMLDGHSEEVLWKNAMRVILKHFET